MREVICINVGQAGVQIANASWELFCVEHGIEANGRLKLNLLDDDSSAFTTFFNELKNGQYVPRNLTVDLEPSVIDEVRKGVYRHLFHPDFMINATEDGCSNYARGHFTIGKKIIHPVTIAIEKLAEQCDCLQGFFILHSHGGGTGSGMTTLIMNALTQNFAKYSRFELSVFPSPILSVAVVEPYNTIMSLRDTLETSDISNIFNNEAVFGVCTNLLDITRPTYSNLNRVLTHVFSDITVSLRFESTLNSDLTQLGTNLIPYPRIHFITASRAPVASVARSIHEKTTITSMTHNLFRPNHQLITCTVGESVYMSCIIQYRGDISPQEVGAVLNKLKKKKTLQFVDWCPTGFKIGINCQPPSSVAGSEMSVTNRSGAALINSGSVAQPLESLHRKFNVLFTKRSFVHWFVGEGMEEGEFNEAKDEMGSILKDYEELCVIRDPEDDDFDDFGDYLPPVGGGGGLEKMDKTQTIRLVHQARKDPGENSPGEVEGEGNYEENAFEDDNIEIYDEDDEYLDGYDLNEQADDDKNDQSFDDAVDENNEDPNIEPGGSFDDNFDNQHFEDETFDDKHFDDQNLDDENLEHPSFDEFDNQ